MKAEVRDLLGKAAYEARKASFDAKYGDSGMPWEEATEDVRELYRIGAEAVVRHLAAMVGVPMLQLLLSEDDVKQLLEQLGGAQ